MASKTVRTKDEIEAQAYELEAMKPTVRQYSHFGDDNWARIEAQIAVLRENLSEREIEDRYLDGGVYDEAMLARAWMNGEDPEGTGEDLVASWKPLVLKKK